MCLEEMKNDLFMPSDCDHGFHKECVQNYL
jgi:hypothetical protein